MKNTTSDEDGKQTFLIAILVIVIAAAALFLPMPPEEAPIEPLPVPHLIEKAEAKEPIEVLIATTSNHVVEADIMVVEKTGDSEIEDLADAIIDCESSWRNIEIIDTNGKWSRGIAQFQDTTWDWLSGLAGVTGSSMEPEKAREVLVWSLENGYGSHWTCYHLVKGT
jgi:hypothetical protein